MKQQYKRSVFFLSFPSFFLAILFCWGVKGQSVGISNSLITPDASSILELRTTSKGLLIPRMTTTQRDAIISPANGLIIFNTDIEKVNFYDTTASVWRILFSGVGNINSISGTVGRINISGSATDPLIDISSNYVGQNSITTVGSITSGSWNASTIDIIKGGTGSTNPPLPGAIIYGSSATTYSSTAAGSAGQILLSGGSSSPLWSTSTYPSSSSNQGSIIVSDGINFNAGGLSNQSNYLLSDIPLSKTPSTFTDGPNISLLPGTWFVTGTITCTTSISNVLSAITAKLWDGSSVYASSEYFIAKGGGANFTSGSITLSGIIKLSSSTIIKISVADASGNASILKAIIPNNPEGKTASYLTAFRIGN